MDPEEKKWFVIGLLFTIIAGAGAITIYVGISVRMGVERMGMIWMLLTLGNTKRLNFSTIVTYIGVSLCIAGGILAILGWIKYYRVSQGIY